MPSLLELLESLDTEYHITYKCSRNRMKYSSCNYCMDACSYGAISINDRLPEINRELCLLCGDCMDACPLSAMKGVKKKLSRRDLLSSLSDGGRMLITNLAPAGWKIVNQVFGTGQESASNPSYSVVIDQNKCTFCRACITFCSQKVFSVFESFLQVENEKCVSCKDCRDICHEHAIQISPDLKVKMEVKLPLFQKKCQDCGEIFKSFQTDAKKCHICYNRDLEWLNPYV